MKKNNRIFMVSLAFVLMFSLIFTGAASARIVQETAAVGTTDDEIERGVAWEMLNSMRFTAEDLLNAAGNDFSDRYRHSLYAYYTYAMQLLESPSSTTAQLNDMYEDMDFIISEQRNPANHSRFGHYTVVFTDNGGWSEPIYLYNWSDAGNEMQAWPGEAMRGGYTNEYGQKQYYAFVPMDVTNIVFSSDQLVSTDPNVGVPAVRIQTEDISVIQNTGFYLTGARDKQGHFKVAEWELKEPVYKQFDVDTDPTQPTEAPTQDPTSTPATIPTEAPTQAPTVNPTVPAQPTIAFNIDAWIPRRENLEVYDSQDNDEKQRELYNLIVSVDTQILAPGNNYTPEYVEKLSRIRNFAAFVYNDRRAAENELLGAQRMLQMAIGDKSYEEIVNCMQQWFNMPVIAQPDPTVPPTEPDIGQYEDDPITDHIIGDADDDGKVTILDATKVQRVLAGYDVDDRSKVERYAAMHESKLTILDATSIQRWLAGYTVAYAVGEHFPENGSAVIYRMQS